MKFFLAYLHPLIFLSLTAVSPALAKYAKIGCSDKCGNVTIPYPFGIGAGCFINQWYVVDCHSSTPYLPALNHLELLGVNLINQTVTVSTPRISYCQKSVWNSNEIMGVDLGRSPFFFSKSHNIFVFEGCGTAAVMDGGRVLAGCSTSCRNITLGDKKNCYGIRCCQTTIPRYLKSYNVNITRLGEEDGGCGSAFLMNEASFEKGRFSDPFIATNASSIPISLLWTLTDFDQATCGDEGDLIRRRVDTFNGTPVDTWECSCYPQLLEDNPYLKHGCSQRYVPPPYYAKIGCKDKCGNVTIPYPFGIGRECSVNEWYIVHCNSSTPYLPALNHLQVLGVSLENQTVIVSTPTPRISDCQSLVRNSSQTSSIDLGGSPFLFSKSHNKFVFEGCGTAVMMNNGSVVTGCSTACRSLTISGRNNCFGFSCCWTPIPHYLKSYSINLMIDLEEEDGGCGSASLVDETLYDQGRVSDPFNVTNNASFSIPISLTWTLAESDEISCCFESEVITGLMLDMLDGTQVYTRKCYTPSSMFGNPYLIDGCTFEGGDSIFIDGLDQSGQCRMCRHSGGRCISVYIYDVDGILSAHNITCYHYKPDEKRISVGVILGISISMSVLFLVAIAYILYKVIKKSIERRQRRRFFKRNGGLLLKQQEEADPSLVDKTIHFTSRELQKATDNFNENRILGRGGQGIVYKGMLVDGKIVAVKKSKIVDESQLEQFINEVVVLSQINHRNVVKLLGCCLETDVPILVSEFIPNGTLYDRLHNESNEFPISLDMRLQIATEVAGALAYLHSSTSVPIYHRDIKTTNILLDDKYRAKVSDFGTSRFVSIDQTHLTTIVKGTFGYLDPEYFQSSQFTEKSDVYSFGVVLLELLTGERPISLTRFGENRSLATHFMLAMEEGRVMSIFDALVIKEGTRDELLIIANLAMRCLNMNGKFRPTMKEVAMELETIRRSHIPSTIPTNTGPVVYGEELSILSYGESSSTFFSFNDSISQ